MNRELKPGESARPAGIEYHGVACASVECEAPVLRLLQAGVVIPQVHLVTADRAHGLILVNSLGDRIAVKSGFASGYGGTGPKAFSKALAFLHAHGASIEEHQVEPAMLERLDRSALTCGDLDLIVEGSPIRPARWSDYVTDADAEAARDGTLWRFMEPLVPFESIDPRLMEFALDFWSDPDSRLIRAYRLLETLVRARTGLEEVGAKLFGKTFCGKDALLTWSGIAKSEIEGRGNLFAAVFMAYRNPRVHDGGRGRDVVGELMMLNQLFRLESEAVAATPDREAATGS